MQLVCSYTTVSEKVGHGKQLITTVDNLLQILNSGLQTDVLLLDFKKEFDEVPHQRFYYKLSHF